MFKSPRNWMGENGAEIAYEQEQMHRRFGLLDTPRQESELSSEDIKAMNRWIKAFLSLGFVLGFSACFLLPSTIGTVAFLASIASFAAVLVVASIYRDKKGTSAKEVNTQ